MEIKKTKKGFEMELNFQPSGGKVWVALLGEKCQKYGRKRKFLPYSKETSSSGKTGKAFFDIKEDGEYEYNEPWKGRGSFIVKNGEIV